MIRELAGVALAFGLAILPPRSAHADPRLASPIPQAPLVFVYDPKLGTEAGVRSADSIGRVIFRYDEALPTFVKLDEKTVLGKTAAVVGRGLQYVLVDDALASFETTIIHEVFGHGARARAFGEDVRFSFSLPGIYCSVLAADDNCTSFAQATPGMRNRDRDLLVTTGGVEANFLTAHWINMRIVQSHGWTHVGDLAVYLQSKLTYVGSFLSTSLDTMGGLDSPSDDIDRSVTLLQDRYNLPRPEDRHRISSRLRTAYLWNLADPGLFYALYGIVYRDIGRGERWTHAPLPTIGRTTFYATPRFNLSPFGAEHYVDVFLGRDSSVLSIYGRAGSSGLASYTGAGVRALGLRAPFALERLSFGGELDVWSQPETLLDDRAVYDRPQRRGFNVGLSGDVRVVGGVGLTARLAYKTRGYLVGQPIDDGVYGYIGASIALDRGAALGR